MADPLPRPDVSAYDALVLDCDGVLWSGPDPILGSIPTVASLLQSGKRLLFVTNNSAASRSQYVAKLARLGAGPVGVGQIVTSGSVTAHYLAQTHPDIKKVYVIGGQGLIDELTLQGIECLGGPADTGKAITEADVARIPRDPSVQAVVVGYDLGWSFYKLAHASVYLQQGALFLATNLDAADRVGPWLMPGNGAILAAVAVGTPNAPPPVVCGKPSAILADHLLRDHGLDPRRCLAVGDRLDTDIALGHRCGMDTLLVLTGVTTAAEADAVRQRPSECHAKPGPPSGPAAPTFVLPDLQSLLAP